MLGQIDASSRAGHASALEADWSKKTAMVLEATVPKPETTRPRCPTTESDCCRFSHCVCRGAGFEAYQLHGNVVALLRPFFRPRRKRKNNPFTPVEELENLNLKASKKLLERGLIVLHMQALHVSEQDSGWEAVADQAVGQESDVLDMNLDLYRHAEKKDLWLHVSYTELKKWLLVVTQLLPNHEKSQDGLLRLELPANPSFGFTFELFQESGLSFDDIWVMSVHSVVNGACPIRADEMTPNYVLVRSFASMPAALRVWQGSEKEAERRRRASATKRKRSGAQRGATDTSKPRSSSTSSCWVLVRSRV